MTRGDVWTASGGQDYASKPRPVVIVQSDNFDAVASITVCPFTTDPSNIPMLRVAIQPSPENGLGEASQIMVDKVTTLPKTKLGKRIGRLTDHDMTRLSRAIIVFLKLAD